MNDIELAKALYKKVSPMRDGHLNDRFVYSQMQDLMIMAQNILLENGYMVGDLREGKFDSEKTHA